MSTSASQPCDMPNTLPTAPPVWNEDAENPHNWKPERRFAVTFLLSALSFNTLMSSTIIAPALPRIDEDLHIGNQLRTQLVLSVYVLAYALGYLFWAPISEVYGRRLILQIANIWFCIWTLVCGFATNEAMITVGRLLSGSGAAASIAIGTGSMGEIWRPCQRGRSLAVLSTITVLGPCIGPILGGIIAEHSMSSWRWAFWSTAIFNAFLQLLCLRFQHESHAQTILQNRRKATKILTAVERVGTRRSNTGQVLLGALRRPFFLLITQRATQGIILYSGIQFGTLYILLSNLTDPFINLYGQSLTTAALNYVSFGIGQTIGSQVCAPIIDAIHRRKERNLLQQENVSNVEVGHDKIREEVEPEVRLYPLMATMVLTSCGLLLFGWSLHYHTHWIVPNCGVVLLTAGGAASVQCINAYMIDSFSGIQASVDTACSQKHEVQPDVNWSASAMASLWAIKSLGGFAFPLLSPGMIDTLGWGWTGTLLALLNLVFGLPAAIVVLVHGEKLRKRGQLRISAAIDNK